MESWEKDLRDLRLAEQEILRQSLEEKAEKVETLERELNVLRGLLNNLVAAPRPQPQAAGTAPKRAAAVPRRWKVS